MFISYSQKKGFLYASITTSRRDGAVVTKEYVNLGRVLDKERGIYQNRQKGVFIANDIIIFYLLSKYSLVK